MERRSFINLLASVAATCVIDPERLLWRPGKLISIPAPHVHTGGMFCSCIPEAFAKVRMGEHGPKIGETLYIRIPPRYVFGMAPHILEMSIGKPLGPKVANG